MSKKVVVTKTVPVKKPSKRYDGKRQSALASGLRNYSTGTAGGSGAGGG